MVTPLVALLSAISSFLILDESSAHPLIWQGPAPPPDEGPPLSASAVRDPSLLWREVAGIVGAYVASVCILLGCLLTVGRRLRHGVQQSNRSLEIEMFKPTAHPAYEPRGQSLDVQSNGKSRQRKHRSFSMPWSNSSSGGPESPASRHGSASTVDESVVRADRQKAQEEMERLYAAVMEHDAQRSTMVYSDSDGDNTSLTSVRPPKSAPVEGFPEFQHLRSRQQPISPVSAKSPGSPLSPKTIPEEQFPPPTSRSQFEQPAQQQHQQQQQQHHHPPPPPSQTEPTSPAQTPKSPISDRLSRISAFSFLSSNKSRESVSSPKKLRRPSPRNLPISPPILSPQAQTQPTYAENQPLSPRIYHPGPPPPNPHQKQSGASPTQAQSPSDSLQPLAVSPASAERRTGGGSAAGTSSSSLPFRAAFSPAQSPTTKTTVVEWRKSQVGRSAPRTGMPGTPYSPYMPFTPVTPITPSRVVTRDQRKRKEKESGLQAMTEEDMVMSDEDIWGA